MMHDSSPIEQSQSSLNTQDNTGFPTLSTIAITFLMLLLAIVLVRCAWVSDDAYISFRTVDNFVNGHGLRWNVDERVQGFTNPLWVFLISLPYAITREMYFTSIFTSIFLSLFAVWYIHRKLSTSFLASGVAITALLMSRAFVDYSTSGLEQPLLFLLAVLFVWRYAHFDKSPAQFGWLCLLASLSAVTRLDTILVYLPALVVAFRSVPTRTAIVKGLIGFAPLIVWELFSIIYYGFPFPNTYYAKLHAGLPRLEVYAQGFIYYLDSLSDDPLTLLAIGTAIVLAFATKAKATRAIAVGVLLYLGYVISVGGDFMSGRFFALPIVLAAAMLARIAWNKRTAVAAIAVLSVVGLVAPYPNLLSDSSFGTKGNGAIKPTGIADERGWYYQSTGLLKMLHSIEMPAQEWAERGKSYKLAKKTVAFESCVGFCGFYAGPQVHMYDGYALTEPLLARLPANPSPTWRIGHLPRTPPFGYDWTLIHGKNLITDSGAAKYYDKLCLITKGPLFSWERLKTIATMNRGGYDQLLKNFWDTTSLSVKYDDFDSVVAEGTAWDVPGNLILRRGGVVFSLDSTSYSPYAEFSSDHNDAYALVFYLDSTLLGRVDVDKRHTPAGGLRLEAVNVIARALEVGYNRVHLFPVYGDDAYSIGHFRLLDKK
jgi:arabinofuranosyltransferase